VEIGVGICVWGVGGENYKWNNLIMEWKWNWDAGLWDSKTKKRKPK